MSKWVKLTQRRNREPLYLNSSTITAVAQKSPDYGASVYTVESTDAWEVTQTAKEVMEKIQEADNG